jgi:hypothetical protein
MQVKPKFNKFTFIFETEKDTYLQQLVNNLECIRINSLTCLLDVLGQVKEQKRPISEKDIYKIIKKLIEFPYSQICVHLVACDLLSLLESKGHPVDKELAKALVRAEDDVSLPLIEKML